MIWRGFCKCQQFHLVYLLVCLFYWRGNVIDLLPLFMLCTSLKPIIVFIATGSQCTCRSALLWRHNERDSVSNHQPHDCLLKSLFRYRSKKTSKLRVTGLFAGIHRVPLNSPHKWSVTRKMFPFDDVIMAWRYPGLVGIIYRCCLCIAGVLFRKLTWYKLL